MSRIEKLREHVHRRKHKLSELPPDMQTRVLSRRWKMAKQWEDEHGRPCSQRMLAILTGTAIRAESDPHLAHRQAGRKSYRKRCEREGEDAVRRHLAKISQIGVAARRFQRETGRCWKEGWKSVNGSSSHTPASRNVGRSLWRSGQGNLDGI